MEAYAEVPAVDNSDELDAIWKAISALRAGDSSVRLPGRWSGSAGRIASEFNDFASQRGGIPLLNQSPFVTQAQAQKAFGDRWQQFSDAVHSADPTGRLLSPFFAGLLNA